jgi:hypothetical protein
VCGPGGRCRLCREIGRVWRCLRRTLRGVRMVGRHVGRRDEGFGDVGEGRLYAQRIL